MMLPSLNVVTLQSPRSSPYVNRASKICQEKYEEETGKVGKHLLQEDISTYTKLHEQVSDTQIVLKPLRFGGRVNTHSVF